jgi:hypothetical protein
MITFSHLFVYFVKLRIRTCNRRQKLKSSSCLQKKIRTFFLFAWFFPIFVRKKPTSLHELPNYLYKKTRENNFSINAALQHNHRLLSHLGLQTAETFGHLLVHAVFVAGGRAHRRRQRVRPTLLPGRVAIPRRRIGGGRRRFFFLAFFILPADGKNIADVVAGRFAVGLLYFAFFAVTLCRSLAL